MSKYIGTLMHKIKLSDNMVIFCVDGIVRGELEEENTFVDKEGNKYPLSLSQEGIEEDTYKTVGFIKELEELKETLGENYLNDLKEIFKNKTIVVRKTSTGEYKGYCFDLDSFFEKDEERLNDEQKPSSEENTQDTTAADYEQLFEQLFNNLEGLSKEELIMMRNELIENKQKMETALKKINEKLENSSQNKKKKKNDLDINSLYKSITKTIVAQENPVRRLLGDLDQKERVPIMRKKGILLTGNIGVGKTELMKQISKYFDRPFLRIDATQISLTGDISKALENYMWDLLVDCDYDIDRAKTAIIFIDNLDQKVTPNYLDIIGQELLNKLTPFIEGTLVEADNGSTEASKIVELDTTNMIKVFAGEFNDVYNDSQNKNVYGFAENVSTTKENRIIKQDFIKKAYMNKRFMSILTIIRLNDFDANSLKRVILESDISLLKNKQNLFNSLGVSLTYTDSFIDKLAEQSYKLNEGAKGIGDILDDSLWMAYDEAISYPRKNSKDNNQYELCLTEDILEDPSRYEIREVKKYKTHQKRRTTN